MLVFGAVVYVDLGDRPTALAWLERAGAAGHGAPRELDDWIELDALKGEPRYRGAVQYDETRSAYRCEATDKGGSMPVDSRNLSSRPVLSKPDDTGWSTSFLFRRTSRPVRSERRDDERHGSRSARGGDTGAADSTTDVIVFAGQAVAQASADTLKGHPEVHIRTRHVTVPAAVESGVEKGGLVERGSVRDHGHRASRSSRRKRRRAPAVSWRRRLGPSARNRRRELKTTSTA